MNLHGSAICTCPCWTGCMSTTPQNTLVAFSCVRTTAPTRLSSSRCEPSPLTCVKLDGEVGVGRKSWEDKGYGHAREGLVKKKGPIVSQHHQVRFTGWANKGKIFNPFIFNRKCLSICGKSCFGWPGWLLNILESLPRRMQAEEFSSACLLSWNMPGCIHISNSTVFLFSCSCWLPLS